MAKIKLYNDPSLPWFAFVAHWGNTTLVDPYCWHSVHEHTIWNMPRTFYGLWFDNQPSEIDARLEALDFQALPSIVRGICPYCWDQDYSWSSTPRWPRWGCRIASSLAIVPPVIYWDCNNPDPPPGFDYNWGP